jgi:hypothetical protein
MNIKSFFTAAALLAFAGSGFALADPAAAPAAAPPAAAPAAAAPAPEATDKEANGAKCSAEADKFRLHGRLRKKFRRKCKAELKAGRPMPSAPQ